MTHLIFDGFLFAKEQAASAPGKQAVCQRWKTMPGAGFLLDADIAPGPLWWRINALLASRRGPVFMRRLAYGTIEMDVEGHKVTAAGSPLALNRTSFSILRLFLENHERILTRQEISSALGEVGLRRERTIDVHIRTLRQAMKPGAADTLIVTVPQSGYVLCDRAACDCQSVAVTAGLRAVAR